MTAANDPNAPAQTVPARPETLLDCLRRRLAPAVGFALLLAVVAAAAVWISLPGPRHTFRTRLRVPPVHNWQVDLGEHQRKEVALATSTVVLAAAVRDPEAAKLSVIASSADPVVWLQRDLRVDFSVAPEIMQISLSGTKTDELKVLVTAVRDAYLTEVVERERRLKLDQQALQVQLAAPSRVTKLEDATVVRADGREREMMLAGGVGLGAFCLALFGVAGLEYRQAWRKRRPTSA